MSRPGFTILNSQVGKQDVYLTGSSSLYKRLSELQEIREKQGRSHPAIDVEDVAKSHSFFFTTKFIPHIKMGHEYQKITSESGSSFSLNDTGHSNSVRISFKECQGDFINDMVVHVIIQGLGVPGAPLNTSPRYRYCDKPGIRLFKNVKLLFDELVADEYTTEDALFHDKFYLPAGKQQAWLKSIGQETPRTGSYYHKDFQVKQSFTFTDGPQTFKVYQDKLEMWVPLLFWFAEDVKQSLQRNLIGTDQQYVQITLADINSIVQTMLPDGTIAEPRSNAALKNLKIEKFDLYVRNWYIDPIVRDVLCCKDRFAIIRTRRTHVKQLNKNSDNILLSQLKYPIEHMVFGFRPNINNSIFNPDSFSDWTQFGTRLIKEVPIPVVINNNAVFPVQQLVIRTAVFNETVPLVRRVGFKGTGDTIYSNLPFGFYDQYSSYTYPGIESINENGIGLVRFNMYAKNFNPSGHYNNSQARELYLMYTDSDISIDNPATLYVSSRCINFLYMVNGTSFLKYAA